VDSTCSFFRRVFNPFFSRLSPLVWGLSFCDDTKVWFILPSTFFTSPLGPVYSSFSPFFLTVDRRFSLLKFLLSFSYF